MKMLHRFTVRLTLLLGLTVVGLHAADEPIDFDRARQIYERIQHGQEVTPEERAYLERAKKARQERNRPPAPPKWAQPLTPLTELGAGRYKGEEGGLYGGGKNEPPRGHLVAAQKEAAQIRPLDANGNPSNDGKIGLLSVGMSNATQEFSQFAALANRDPQKSQRVVLVDGAQGGQTGMRWANANSPLWYELERRIEVAGVTPGRSKWSG